LEVNFSSSTRCATGIALPVLIAHGRRARAMNDPQGVTGKYPAPKA
jgi:hypothetical protein